MTNQPDIIRPRVRRHAGRDGNASASLAEQSTRVLIRLPRIADATPSPSPAGKDVRPATTERPASATPISVVNNSINIPTTTSAAPQSSLLNRPATSSAAAESATEPRYASRIDSAHTAAIAPHAPDWLNDQPGGLTGFVQKQWAMIGAVVVGIALGAFIMHNRGVHNAAHEANGSHINAATQQAIEPAAKPVNATADTADVRSNEPASISHGSSKSNGAGSMWQWNPPAGANTPATISQPTTQSNNPALESASCATPADATTVSPSNNPSGVWLQGTISTPSVPIQR